MANSFTRHIPNTITCLNLFFGCVACVMAFQADYLSALAFMSLSAVLDFLDGMLARVLNAPSPIGKELDSLADDISFGMVPALIVFSLFKEVNYLNFSGAFLKYVPYLAFIIAVFSALRLAKFNVDERQTDAFIGLPTPANALFWAASTVGLHSFLVSSAFNFIYLIILVVLFSVLMVSEIPMFALKFKNLSWKYNKTRFIFLFGCILFLALWGITGIAASIVWYLLLSLLTGKFAKE